MADAQSQRFRLFDAQGQTLGSMASRIATVLQGKDKPTYDPRQDRGDICVVLNAKYVELTGKKWVQKTYWTHSGKPGNKHEWTALEQWKEDPTFIVHKAVYNMLPRNNLRKRWTEKLFVFRDEEHPFQDPNQFPLRSDPIPPRSRAAAQSMGGLVSANPVTDRRTAYAWARGHKPGGRQGHPEWWVPETHSHKQDWREDFERRQKAKQEKKMFTALAEIKRL